MIISHVGFGFYISGVANNGQIYLTKKIAPSSWGLFTVNSGDLILLNNAVEKGVEVPSLESLTCVTVAETRNECLEAGNHHLFEV